MGLGLDPDWRRQIALIRTKYHMTFQQLAAREWTFVFRLLNEYKRAVSVAMGSLDARGSRRGYPILEFHDPFGASGTLKAYEEWAPLSIFTIQKKAEELYGAEGSLKEVYDEYADDINIWEFHGDDGGARSALVIDVRKGFAGIRNRDIVRYARKVEFGGKSEAYGPESEYTEAGWQSKMNGGVGKRTRRRRKKGEIPPRHLFTAVNQLFMEYLHSQLRSYKSPLRKAILKEVKEKLYGRR